MNQNLNSQNDIQSLNSQSDYTDQMKLQKHDDIYFSSKMPRAETEQRKKLRQKAPLILSLTFLYTLFFAWGLWDSVSGLMLLLFSAATVLYFTVSVRLMGLQGKKIHILFAGAIVLLGVSQFMSDSIEIHFYNLLMFLILILAWMVTSAYDCGAWGVGQYVKSAFGAAFGCIRYLGDFSSDILYYIRNLTRKKQDERSRQTAKSVCIGIFAGIPVVAVMISLLCSSDIIFKNLIENITDVQLPSSVFQILTETVLLGIYLYIFLVGIANKEIRINTKERRTFDAVVAVTTYSMLTLVYLIFAFVQIGGLMLRKMQLPDGYTYAHYAREGFFSLLFVCALNIIFVIIGKLYFHRSTVLQIILNVICGCTIIMIISSALKMYMYIGAYGMTRLRFKVVLALAVISLIMIGVIIWLNVKKYPLLRYSAAVLFTIFMVFSLCRPDYWIAKYNLYCFDDIQFTTREIYNGWETSLDAVPAVVDYMDENHPDWLESGQTQQDCQIFEAYKDMAEEKYSEMQPKDFNLSVYTAAKLLNINLDEIKK